GLMLLMGPILYLYARGERFKVKDTLHLVPYLIFLLFSLPMFFIDKTAFITEFISGRLQLRSIDYAIFTIQVIHLLVYVFCTVKTNSWVRSLTWFLFGYAVLVAGLAVFTFTTGRYSLTVNYTYTLACSFLLYGITGYSLLNPSGAIESRKKIRKPLDNMNVSAYWEKLQQLMEQQKIFVRPEIKLQEVAQMIGLNAHQLSQLINERSGKNFSDYINHYRVEEFKARVKDSENDQLTLVGLALEIGFNSKTSFNNTFKKFTGVTPSEWKKRGSGL
ncbi:MAG TPA: helix-turn-helix domain-containing protein, partial [Cyclobacteriaceae bacterium]|nr:helix-turn-helix domain-containing protein [Cyclobacteriaceae bacterium]